MSFINNKDLLELISSLAIITELPVSVYDENFNILPGFDTNYRTDFCTELQKNPVFAQKCLDCDNYALKRVKHSGNLLIYKCHIGLIETATPIIKNNKICGYIMIGQLTNNEDREQVTLELINACSAYADAEKITELAKSIKYKTPEQLFAAAKLLDICATHIQLKEMLRPSDEQLLVLIEDYINKHLTDSITISKLCTEFNISRSRLYATVSTQINGGIAAFVKSIRLTHAKKLLTTTDFSLHDIALRTGFSNNNYFSKAFKQKYGVTPKKFKKTIMEEQTNVKI